MFDGAVNSEMDGHRLIHRQAQRHVVNRLARLDSAAVVICLAETLAVRQRRLDVVVAVDPAIAVDLNGTPGSRDVTKPEIETSNRSGYCIAT
jgi:hypothetical protein